MQGVYTAVTSELNIWVSTQFKSFLCIFEVIF